MTVNKLKYEKTILQSTTENSILNVSIKSLMKSAKQLSSNTSGYVNNVLFKKKNSFKLTLLAISYSCIFVSVTFVIIVNSKYHFVLYFCF